YLSPLCSPLSLCVALSFLYPSRALRLLHSFPTRRSSDLSLAARVDDHVGEVGVIGDGVVGRKRPRRGGPDDGEQARLRRHRELEDRKSTRLNSSHQIISYAVFCLKKKKEKQTL